ncbi:MAG: OmpA family protein [Rhodothermales bacterium]|nr:OmpA family protein [Rhodothermales bacterium]
MVSQSSYSILILAACLGLAACGTPQIVIDQRETIDSLNVAYASLQDSLAFYESIDSGSYYRELRVRDMRINELEYQLGTAADGTVLASELVDDLFQPASADLLESGKARLDSLARIFDDLPDKQHVRIQAHADNIPPGPTLRDRYPSNWELSAARASAIARYLIDAGVVSTAERLEVVSLGDTQPLFTNQTPEGRKRNRRVDFVLPGFCKGC